MQRLAVASSDERAERAQDLGWVLAKARKKRRRAYRWRGGRRGLRSVLARWPAYGSGIHDLGLRAAAALPLTAAGTRIGVLVVYDHESLPRLTDLSARWCGPDRGHPPRPGRGPLAVRGNRPAQRGPPGRRHHRERELRHHGRPGPHQSPLLHGEHHHQQHRPPNHPPRPAPDQRAGVGRPHRTFRRMRTHHLIRTWSHWAGADDRLRSRETTPAKRWNAICRIDRGLPGIHGSRTCGTSDFPPSHEPRHHCDSASVSTRPRCTAGTSHTTGLWHCGQGASGVAFGLCRG